MHMEEKWVNRSCGCLTAMFIAVLALVVLIIGAFYLRGEFEASSEKRRSAFENAEKIEELTGFHLPEFEIVEHKMGEPHVTGDIIDTLVVKYKVNKLDGLSAQLVENKNWHSLSDDSLSFQYDNQERRFFINLVFYENTNEGEIIMARW